MTTTRTERILEAALASATELGYEQATIADIRERSGVSNGALFHHFASKEAIFDALYVQAIASFQSGLWEMLRRRPRSLRAAVRGTIAHQLSWVELNSDLARFVYLRGHLDWDSAGAAEVSTMNAELGDAFRGWMTPLREKGELRVSSMLLTSAIVNGPAHAIARRWLAGHLERPPTAYVEPLADAAWAALRGEPLGAAAVPTMPATALITVELIDEDGAVTARVHDRADLRTESRSARTGATRKERR